MRCAYGASTCEWRGRKCACSVYKHRDIYGISCCAAQRGGATTSFRSRQRAVRGGSAGSIGVACCALLLLIVTQAASFANSMFGAVHSSLMSFLSMLLPMHADIPSFIRLAAAAAPTSSASVFTPLPPNPCTQSWTEPSTSNSFSECFSGDGAGDLWGDWVVEHSVWQFGVPMAVGLLILFPLSCAVLCGRYMCGCCGSSRSRPLTCCGCSKADKALDEADDAYKQSLYSTHGIIATKAAAIIVALAAGVGAALCVCGGVTLFFGIGDIRDAADGLLEWFTEVVDIARLALLSGNGSGGSGSPPSGYDASVFEALVDDVAHYYKTYFSDMVEVHKVSIAAACLAPASFAAVPAALAALPAVAAIGNIRNNIPAIVAVAAFPLQFVCFTLATLLLVLLLPIDIVCEDLAAAPPTVLLGNNSGEDGGGGGGGNSSVDVTVFPERSISQWYLMPLCEESPPFAPLLANAAELEAEAAAEACRAMAAICSNATHYATDPSDTASQVFSCALFTTNSTNTNINASLYLPCADSADAAAIAATLALRPDAAAVETCGLSSSSSNTTAETCSLQVCAEQCDVAVKDNAAKAVDALDAAARAATAVAAVKPWTDCQRLYAHARSLGPQQACDTLRRGLSFFKDGAIVLSAALVAAILVALLGQKRFIPCSAKARRAAAAAVLGGGKGRGGFGSDLDDCELGEFSETKGVGTGTNPLVAQQQQRGGAPTPPLAGYVTVGGGGADAASKPLGATPGDSAFASSYRGGGASSGFFGGRRFSSSVANNNNNNINASSSFNGQTNSNSNPSAPLRGGGGANNHSFSQRGGDRLSGSMRNGHVHAAAAAAAADRLMMGGAGVGGGGGGSAQLQALREQYNSGVRTRMTSHSTGDGGGVGSGSIVVLTKRSEAAEDMAGGNVAADGNHRHDDGGSATAEGGGSPLTVSVRLMGGSEQSQSQQQQPPTTVAGRRPPVAPPSPAKASWASNGRPPPPSSSSPRRGSDDGMNVSPRASATEEPLAMLPPQSPGGPSPPPPPGKLDSPTPVKAAVPSSDMNMHSNTSASAFPPLRGQQRPSLSPPAAALVGPTVTTSAAHHRQPSSRATSVSTDATRVGGGGGGGFSPAADGGDPFGDYSYASPRPAETQAEEEENAAPLDFGDDE